MANEELATAGAVVPDDRARWAATVCAELGIPAEVLVQVSDPLLDMVRDVAHQVNRPSAPLTAFLVGLASGSASPDGTDLAAQVNARLEQAAHLISAWEPTPSD